MVHIFGMINTNSLLFFLEASSIFFEKMNEDQEEEKNSFCSYPSFIKNTSAKTFTNFMFSLFMF